MTGKSLVMKAYQEKSKGFKASLFIANFNKPQTVALLV